MTLATAELLEAEAALCDNHAGGLKNRIAANEQETAALRESLAETERRASEMRADAAVLRERALVVA